MFRTRNLLAAGILLCMMAIPAQAISASSMQTITIIAPGEGSILSSPIHLTAEVRLEPGDFVRVTLTNGSNLSIARHLYRVSSSEGEDTLLEIDLPFEIPTDTAKARLTISILDRYHRPKSLRSMTLTLSSNGTNIIEPQENQEPWLTISEPEPQASISGGQIYLRGTVIPQSEMPLLFELITDSGGIIWYTILGVDTPGEPFAFDLQLSYDFITTTQDARLVIRQTTESYNANVVLDSIPLTLMP